MARSYVEYWLLAMRNEHAKLFSRTHDPNDIVHILGMRLHTFSLQTLCILVDEIFLEREYSFTPHSSLPAIIDCGSNIGISILFFKKLFPQARIIGFEPDLKTFELLSRNVTENGLSGVSLHNAAVSSKTGEVAFFSDSLRPGSLIMSTVMERTAGNSRQVPCVALSGFVKDSAIDLLKMDIEGAEMDVMLELEAAGVLQNIKAMALEFHHHIKPEEERFPEMLRLLDRHSFGYDVAATLPGILGKFQDIRLRIYKKGA
jgi:FkbM family methyltransferase